MLVSVRGLGLCDAGWIAELIAAAFDPLAVARWLVNDDDARRPVPTAYAGILTDAPSARAGSTSLAVARRPRCGYPTTAPRPRGPTTTTGWPQPAASGPTGFTLLNTALAERLPAVPRHDHLAAPRRPPVAKAAGTARPSCAPTTDRWTPKSCRHPSQPPAPTPQRSTAATTTSPAANPSNCPTGLDFNRCGVPWRRPPHRPHPTDIAAIRRRLTIRQPATPTIDPDAPPLVVPAEPAEPAEEPTGGMGMSEGTEEDPVARFVLPSARQAVVVLSGGVDSTTLAFLLARRGIRLVLVSVDYGQRHRVELQAARRVASLLRCPHHVVDLSGLAPLLAGSALTDAAVAVPDGHYEAETMRATVVPHRNALLLDVAVAAAVAAGADTVAYGAHGGDHAIYPDCRSEFVEAYRRMVQVANEGHLPEGFQVVAPFLPLSKTDIVRLGSDAGVPFAATWSCYRGGSVHCGTCGTCVERREAFILAGVPDPTIYAAPVQEPDAPEEAIR